MGPQLEWAEQSFCLTPRFVTFVLPGIFAVKLGSFCPPGIGNKAVRGPTQAVFGRAGCVAKAISVLKGQACFASCLYSGDPKRALSFWPRTAFRGSWQLWNAVPVIF